MILSTGGPDAWGCSTPPGTLWAELTMAMALGELFAAFDDIAFGTCAAKASALAGAITAAAELVDATAV